MMWEHIANERLNEIDALKEAHLDVKKEDPNGYGFQNEVLIDEITYHDEDTLTKVNEALKAVGLKKQQRQDAISLMQNAGIYFRERRPNAG
jgi:hypothetical protein